jgi:rRNA-processing protein FCF1
MRKAILDTNFILTCVNQKIDFFEELELRGIKAIIPDKVIAEIKGISESKRKLRFREAAQLSLDLIKLHKYGRIRLGGKNVDAGIIKYAKQNPEFFVATLDREIKKKVVNSKIVIREKKRLEII